ncbi:molecular chaperone DnaJ [Mycobacterium hackensackense]|uniref:molecular chaperone DnaJ n=1 Tax=Mycobacterium hackensackense TaxID=228909 RepID=UPI002265EF31|nr:molecular chaperone DnaJ [Mycobacterium hackensackense]MCV7255647.1 molecular chaperone DnaJ [Mycobacterium hackensackense]
MSGYPPGMTLRPIVAWPRELTRDRQRSPFSATWTSTMTILDRELHHLGAGRHRADSVLQIALREQDFRLDGMPYARAVPDHPGVILNIDGNKGPMSMPCDKFNRWQDNLRAIALSLEALRRVDRYGTTPGNEQYRGWLAIEQAGSAASPREAAEVLAKAAGLVDVVFDMSHANVTRLYRSAVKAAHPDRNGGDQTLWDTVERAAGLLRGTGYLS